MYFPGTHIPLFHRHGTGLTRPYCAFLLPQSFSCSHRFPEPARLPVLRQTYNATRNRIPDRELFSPQSVETGALADAIHKPRQGPPGCAAFSRILQKISDYRIHCSLPSILLLLLTLIIITMIPQTGGREKHEKHRPSPRRFMRSPPALLQRGQDDRCPLPL